MPVPIFINIAFTISIKLLSLCSFITLPHFSNTLAYHSGGSSYLRCAMNGIKAKIWKPAINSLKWETLLNFYRYSWILPFKPIGYKIHIMSPRIRPSRTWFKLWAPRYILEIGINITAAIEIQIFIKLGPGPLWLRRIPKPKTAENQLWPLGFPYSTGQ